MHDRRPDWLAEVRRYYAARLEQHGETPPGVDWNSAASQTLRFEQLCRVIETARDFSINDLGCGYGALLEFLMRNRTAFSYLGIDIAGSMVDAARKRCTAAGDVRFIVGGAPDRVADFGIASGIFNVRLDCPDAAWRSHVEATLDVLNQTSRKGFSFNCLTSYSDADKMRDDLYYADPRELFDLCKQRYSRNVALLHDYGLYEFTLLVRKS